MEPRSKGTIPNFGGSDIGSQFLPNKNSPTRYALNKDRESRSKNKNIKNTKIMTKKPLSFISDSIMYSLILLRNDISHRHKAGLYKLLLSLWAKGKIHK